MRTHPVAIALVLFGPILTAQSSPGTLPKGWDSTEGIVIGTTTNDSFWTNFDTGTAYNPAKAVYLYDSADFPWDRTTSYIITDLSFRRDGLYSRNGMTTTGALTKKWVVIMSTSNVTPAHANFNYFDGNHGTNRTVVYGKIGTPKDLVLPATPAPTSGTAPFNAKIKLDTLFIVPANAKTLVIEIRTYGETVQSAGWWQADSVRYPGTNYNGGSYSLHNTDHCVSPSILFHARVVSIGSNFVHVWRTNNPPGGKTMLSWLGPKLNTPFLFPGTQCNVHVFPVLALIATTTLTSGEYAGFMDWGTVPELAALVGFGIDHQSLVADTSYAGSVGLTRAGRTVVGSAYDPNVTKGSAAYSYGPNTIMYHGPSSTTLSVMPDKEKYARYLYRRSLIIKIN